MGARTTSRAAAALVAALAVSSATGCASWVIDEEEPFWRHRVVVDGDTLGPEPAAPAPCAAPYALDLEVVGFAGDDASLLTPVIAALDADPRLELGRLVVRGPDAPGLVRQRLAGPPAPSALRLRCRSEFSGRWYNALIAFPGLLPFLPVWYGYVYDLELELTGELRVGRLVRPGSIVVGPPRPVRRRARAELRELNCPTSALFHIWPLHGFHGVQFVASVFMAPFMIPYDGGATTERLAEVWGARVGRRFCEDVVAALEAAGALRYPRGEPWQAPALAAASGSAVGSGDR